MKVFISHAHSDEQFAQKVTVILEQAGLEVWDVTREVMPGDNWAAIMSQALRESQAMVVLLTAHAMRSKWVRSEIEYALGEIRFRSRLIPVVVGDPEALKKEDVPWVFRHMKTIRLTDHANEEEGSRKSLGLFCRLHDDLSRERLTAPEA